MMGINWRRARGKRSPRAGRAPRAAAVLLAAGTVAVMTGIAVLGFGLAPMFGFGNETATVNQPLQSWIPSDVSPGSSTAGGRGPNLPALVDGPVKGVAFQMRIAALDYSATVVEGVDRNDLAHGPGHYPTTAWPGNAGTVGVAAHNVYWLSFNRLKSGDHVELQTPHGLFVYEITGSKITVASDIGVLEPTGQPSLTLTTCYPLWAGVFATRRLVFFAREIGGVA
jgi:LPXTG-site transpeptidase (sortase) family protein